MIKIFLILYFCNLVLDYPLQDEFLKKYKCVSNYALFVHCAIWSIGISLALMYLEIFVWWKLIMLLVGHYLIDYWKCRGIYKRFPYRTKHFSSQYDELTGKFVYDVDKKIPIFYDERKGDRDWRSLYVDQALHVVQILLCLL